MESPMSGFIEIAGLPTRENGIHESVFRSYHLLEKVKALLQDGVPAKVILEIIDEIEGHSQNSGGTHGA
jgi:hypothetical protein